MRYFTLPEKDIEAGNRFMYACKCHASYLAERFSGEDVLCRPTGIITGTFATVLSPIIIPIRILASYHPWSELVIENDEDSPPEEFEKAII